MAVFLEIAQPAIWRLWRIILISAINSWETVLGHPGPLSDFLSRCCFFVYVLSAIQIAQIMKFITLVAVIGPSTSWWYLAFVGIKPNLSFHILRNNLLLFRLFLLHWCNQLSRNTHLGTGHFTGWYLQRFAKQGFLVYRFEVRTYAHDWGIKRLSHRSLMYKMNEFSALSCLLFCLNVFTNMSFHRIVHVVQNDVIPLK